MGGGGKEKKRGRPSLHDTRVVNRNKRTFLLNFSSNRGIRIFCHSQERLVCPFTSYYHFYHLLFILVPNVNTVLCQTFFFFFPHFGIPLIFGNFISMLCSCLRIRVYPRSEQLVLLGFVFFFMLFPFLHPKQQIVLPFSLTLLLALY